MDHKTRANKSDTGVPQNRQEIYREAIEQYEKVSISISSPNEFIF